MIPTIRFILITALRDRLFASLFAVLALGFAVSAYLGSAAVAEAWQAGLVYAAGSARVVLVLGLAVFVAFQTERLYESREIEAILSRPLTRGGFVFAYWSAVAAVAILAIIPLFGLILLFDASVEAVALWLSTVLLECLVVAAFAIFCGINFERAVPTIFATAGFYALARLVGFFVGVAEGLKQTGLNRLANPIMEAFGYLLPRLDLAGQTEWLVYEAQVPAQSGLILVQAVIYVVLLLSAAVFDLRRKRF